MLRISGRNTSIVHDVSGILCQHMSNDELEFGLLYGLHATDTS